MWVRVMKRERDERGVAIVDRTEGERRCGRVRRGEGEDFGVGWEGEVRRVGTVVFFFLWEVVRAGVGGRE